MGKSFINCLIILLGVIIFSACRKVIEIDLPETKIEPVVNCLFEEGKPFKLHLSLTKEASDTADYLVDNAEIKITGDNDMIASLVYIGDGYYSDSTVISQKGTIYFLSVKIPGFEEVQSQSQIPGYVIEIPEIKSESGFRTETVTGMGDEARIPVQDITLRLSQNDQKNDFMGISATTFKVHYYYVNDSLLGEEYTDEYEAGFLNSNDPAIKNEGLEYFDEHYLLLFRDLTFTAINNSIELNIEKRVKSNYWLRFYQFSPEAFNYLKSWVIHDYTKDYDFWEVYEPLPLYSNIENGYGIFAGYSSQLFEVWPDSTVTFE